MVAGFVVRGKPVQSKQPGQDPPFDVGSFLLGVAAGGVITLVVEGVLIYFTWPSLLRMAGEVLGRESVRSVLEALK